MIIWFSGTGNSRIVAKLLGKKLGDDTFIRIDSDAPEYLHCGADEKIVWVFPVYSWGVPPAVRKYIREVQIDGGTRHFMVCTCGDDCGLTYEMWRKEIRNRGWSCGGGFSVQMPNTYVSLPGFDVDNSDLAMSKLKSASEKIDYVERAIRVGSRVDATVRGRFAWLKTRIIYPLFMRFLMSPRPFRHTSACVECGKCASICPMRNITIANGGPYWGKNCAGCLACYHACPQNAVQYGCRTKGKGHYLAPERLL